MNGYNGDPIHIDYLGIPGAWITDLHHAWMAEYEYVDTPVDVVLMAGLNDILNDQSAEEIMRDILYFRKSVKEITRHGERSSFAVCTLPFAPHLYLSTWRR